MPSTSSTELKPRMLTLAANAGGEMVEMGEAAMMDTPGFSWVGGNGEAGQDVPAACAAGTTARLFLVELADQRQGEGRTHVLEVRAHLDADLVDAGLAGDILDG